MNKENFIANRITQSHRQTIFASPEKVFPLLCPVREADWLDGWQYNMVYSESGLVEPGAVFTTPHHDDEETTWVVTKHDRENFLVEFVRFTPGSRTCCLYIRVAQKNSNESYVDISYTYTAVSQHGNDFIESFTEASFQHSMKFWEDAMNHYLQTDEMLPKEH